MEGLIGFTIPVLFVISLKSSKCHATTSPSCFFVCQLCVRWCMPWCIFAFVKSALSTRFSLQLFSFSLSFFSSQTIQINIIDDEEYEKNKNFFLEIGEPRLVELSERKGGASPFPGFGPSPNPTHSLSVLAQTKILYGHPGRSNHD